MPAKCVSTVFLPRHTLENTICEYYPQILLSTIQLCRTVMAEDGGNPPQESRAVLSVRINGLFAAGVRETLLGALPPAIGGLSTFGMLEHCTNATNYLMYRVNTARRTTASICSLFRFGSIFGRL